PQNSQVADFQTVVNNYDAIGRVTSQTQRIKNNAGTWFDYTVTRQYDLASHVTQQNYPVAGHRVLYTYDRGGRTSNFLGNLGGMTSQNGYVYYAADISYTPAGQIVRESFNTFQYVGANLYHGMGYNLRLQMVETTLGTNLTDPRTWTRGRLWFFYNANAVLFN